MAVADVDRPAGRDDRLGGAVAGRLRDDVAGTLSVVYDRPNGLASLRQFRLGSIEPAQRCLAVRHHRGEWLIDLVRDQGGKFSQHRDAGGVCEVRLQLLKCRLRTSALGDVDEADKADFELVGPSESRTCAKNVDDAPVQGRDFGLFLEDPLAPESGFQTALECLRTDAPIAMAIGI